MKAILKATIISLICLCHNLNTYPQSVLVLKGDTIDITNDSILLFVKDYRGQLQWQSSVNQVEWTHLSNETKDTLLVRTTSSNFFRVMITEGTCIPVYSDTMEVYKNNTSHKYTIVDLVEDPADSILVFSMFEGRMTSSKGDTLSIISEAVNDYQLFYAQTEAGLTTAMGLYNPETKTLKINDSITAVALCMLNPMMLFAAKEQKKEFG